MRVCLFTFVLAFSCAAAKRKSSDSTSNVREKCAWHNGGCAQICLVSQNGEVRCSCEPGFKISHRAKDCQDVNECIEQRNAPGMCEHDCTNIPGSYICSCKNGYELQSDGRSCHRKDRSSSRVCTSNCQQYCNATTRSCGCFDGYRIHTDGRSCVRLCSNGNGGCEHICQENSEATICSCRRSYVLQSDLQSCAVSCAVNNGGCIADCEDTPIGGQCSCPQGFSLQSDHRSCEDINECEIDNGGCEHECRNNQGSYICSCPAGYKIHSNHTSCIDIDECLLNDTCQGGCTNTVGGFECSCPSGYQLFSQIRCGDINECAVNNGGCGHICTNTIGDHHCSCKPGYKLLWNQRDCIRSAKCQNRLAKKFFAGSAKCKGKKCAFNCNVGQKFQVLNPAIPTYEFTCGTAPLKKKRRQRGRSPRLASSNAFPWQPPVMVRNVSLPKCYNGNQFRFISNRIKTDSCRLNTETSEILGNIRSGTFSHIYFNYFSIKCVTLKPKSSVKKRKPKFKLFVEMEIALLANNCNANCVRKKSARDSRKIKISIQKQQLQLKTLTQNLRVRRKTPPSERGKRPLSARNGCLLGRIPNPAHRKCSLCSRGHYFNITSSTCTSCPPRTYQNKPGQLSCELCPLKMAHFPPDPNLEPKTNAQQCQGVCQPGTFSIDGLRPPNGAPCRLCERGTVQPYRGRIGCYNCPKLSTTVTVGSSSFNDCKSRARCTKGHFQHGRSCTRCPKGFYQPNSGKAYCYSCPGNTTTDYDASSKLTDCKQQNCGGVIGDKSGFIESPNYPGDYPINSHCQWELRAPKTRKFLFIIPEVYLPFGDTCGDILTMRTRKNPGPRGTGIIFNTCQTLTNPDPLPVKSKRVFIEFKSNHQNCSKGFQIPYVTYDENYDKIIQSIVKDGRLSALNHFHDILKNKRLRRTLLTVLAEPKEYFDIISQHQEKLFPSDFMVFLQRKVYEVFNYSSP